MLRKSILENAVDFGSDVECGGDDTALYIGKTKTI